MIKRLVAVNMVCIRGKRIQETTDNLMLCPDWVSMWAGRFKEGDIDTIRDEPRPKRKPDVPKKKIQKVIKKMDWKRTPKKLLGAIRQETGHSYSISTAKRMLYKNNMTPKSP